MARSFYYGTDSQVYMSSRSFSQKISADPGAYGLTPERCAEYASVDADYRAAYVAAVTPDTRTKGKISGKNDARASLMALAASLAKVIEGTPTVTDAQKIGLGLSVRGAPTPLANPGTPYKFVANLSVSGAINLQWKCDNPAGATMYQIWRRIGTHAEFVYLGASGKRRFRDDTLPAGSSAMMYQIQAVRASKVGRCGGVQCQHRCERSASDRHGDDDEESGVIEDDKVTRGQGDGVTRSRVRAQSRL